VAITRIKTADGDETTAVRGKSQPPMPGVGEPAPFLPGQPNLAAEDFLAMPGDYGSGVVIGEHGEILTTYHLIKGSARIRVPVASGAVATAAAVPPSAVVDAA